MGNETKLIVGEREHLHDLLQRARSLIDPERHPDLDADILAVLTPCDEAGKCVPLPQPSLSATVQTLEGLVEKWRKRAKRLRDRKLSEGECITGVRQWEDAAMAAGLTYAADELAALREAVSTKADEWGSDGCERADHWADFRRGNRTRLPLGRCGDAQARELRALVDPQGAKDA